MEVDVPEAGITFLIGFCADPKCITDIQMILHSHFKHSRLVSTKLWHLNDTENFSSWRKKKKTGLAPLLPSGKSPRALA